MADGLTISIDEDEAEQLRAAAEARGMTVEAYVRTTLRLGLLQDEGVNMDQADVEEIDERWRDFEESGEAIHGDDMKAWLLSLKTDNPLPVPKARKIR